MSFIEKMQQLIYCHNVKDKNGRKIKSGSVIKIHNDRLSKPGRLLHVRSQYVPEENNLGKILVIYDPNCCIYCWSGFSFVWSIFELDPQEIEVVYEKIITS